MKGYSWAVYCLSCRWGGVGGALGLLGAGVAFGVVVSEFLASLDGVFETGAHEVGLGVLQIRVGFNLVLRSGYFIRGVCCLGISFSSWDVW